MPDTVLQTAGLTKRFGRRVAVDNLSLNVERGNIYGFLGPNGAGKSTTLRMVLGLITPTAGVIRLLNRELGRDPLRARRRVGAIVETPAFYEGFSGRRNLQLLAALSGGAPSQRIDEVLDLVGLSARADEPVRVYSYGMRQRLGIAQALLPAPELIVLDEPTNGLDPQGIHDVRRLIRRLRDELKLTVLLSSHLLAEVEQLCDRVGIIHEGRLLYEGAIEDLITPARVYQLRVDQIEAAQHLLARDPALGVSRNGADRLYVETETERIPGINAELVAHGIKVFELTPRQETLEDVFLRLTGAARVPPAAE
ncbi:MAG TPA: ABC transporter ATP-binding protein [Pyrinomonadaceae bacterium]|jgi:ABC-2 type transport system ATP-binding protein